jgi:peptide/nickel transport system substrate-binding protein
MSRGIHVLVALSLMSALGAQDQGVKETLAQELVFFEEPNRSKAFEMLESGQMHVYAYGLSDPEIKKKIEASKNTTYALSYGNIWELTINPAEFKSGFNPFSSAPIREAINWLLDRNYIAQELNFGLARPKYVPIVSAFPDYARLADVCRAIEVKYAFDTEKARQVITKEMQALGAAQKDGRWMMKDSPVKISFLIRTEDVRKRMGDYISTQLESLGFTVDRQYKTAAEAGPIWIGSEPSEGKWHLYTGGWINTFISRDQGDVFNAYYTPKGRPDTLWQAYKPTKEFADISDRLARNDYKTWDERMDLMKQALEKCNQECYRVWLVDAINYFPVRKDVRIASDLAGGINGSYLWAHTARFVGDGAGKMRIGMPSILTGPWNPVAGSNWIYDTMIIRGTSADPGLPDPFTGLFLPYKVKTAEVTAQEGTPMNKTLDWIEMKYAPSIEVPGDAWLSWNSKEQRFHTVNEKHPGGLKARTKGVFKFQEDMFKRKWHDGTTFTLADLVFGFIVSLERSMPDSPIYDEASVPAYETFAGHFRGLRIVQEDPLVVEYYSDQSFPDAEYYVFNGLTLTIYPLAPAPWHALAIGVESESTKKLAFSEDKAEKFKIEKMSYIAGPSLEILDGITKKAESEGMIPYEKAMSKYVNKDQAKGRYAALRKWYEQKKHFWVGNGPFYIESVHSLEKTVVCKRFEEYREPDRKLMGYSEPRIADVQVGGPARVTIGEAAEFKIKVTFKGAAYPAKDIDFVRFLVFNSKGDVVMVANADASAEGEWTAKIPAEKSKDLKPGVNRIEVAVAPKVVSLASFGSAKFVSLGGGR